MQVVLYAFVIEHYPGSLRKWAKPVYQKAISMPQHRVLAELR